MAKYVMIDSMISWQPRLAALRMMWLELVGLRQKLQGICEMLDGCWNILKAQSTGCIL